MDMYVYMMFELTITPGHTIVITLSTDASTESSVVAGSSGRGFLEVDGRIFIYCVRIAYIFNECIVHLTTIILGS